MRGSVPPPGPRATADPAAARATSPAASRLARLWERRERELPLLVLGGGAGATFLANVVARKMFTAAQFVDWAYLTSLVALFFSFSLLGSEQLIVRLARATDGAFELPRQAIGYIAASFVAFLLAYVVALDGRVFAYRLGFGAVPVLVSVSAIQLTHQLERARGNLLAAQVALNAWKVVLLPVAVLAAVALEERRAVTAALVIGSAFAAWLLLRLRGVFRATPGGGEAGRVFLPFLLSLGVLSALNIADRVTLEKVHASAEFARYVYLTTILVTPFGILSAYFGFKEAVQYRTVYSAAVLRRDAARTMLLATGCVAGWSVLCYATRGLRRAPLKGAVPSLPPLRSGNAHEWRLLTVTRHAHLGEETGMDGVIRKAGGGGWRPPGVKNGPWRKQPGTTGKMCT